LAEINSSLEEAWKFEHINSCLFEIVS